MKMNETVSEVMTPNPRTVTPDEKLSDVAKVMRDADVGALVVCESDVVTGILTDRDIVVRALAEGVDPDEARVADAVEARDVVTVEPGQSVDDVISLMREEKIRRVPVVEDGRAVGIVSLGDLAQDREPRSALAQISEPPANN
jgi:CBS domain-containing protein